MIWQEPPIGGYPDPSLMALPGLEQLRASRDGRVPIPPIAYLMEIPFRELSEGHAGFQMPASPWFANAAGVIPGGFLAVLADAALGAPIHTVLPPGVAYTTAEMSMTLLKPVRPDPEATISGSGQVIHRGRSLALSEAFLYDDRTEDLVAHGTSRCTVFPPIDPLPEPPDELPLLEQPYPGDDPAHPLRRELQGGALGQEVFDRMSGLELLRAQVAGELEPRAPIHYLTGIWPSSVEEGRVTMKMPCSPWLSTALRTVQGGFTAMLAEIALSGAVFSTVEAGTAIAPLDFKVNFLRPVLPDMRELSAEARVEHRGRTLAIASCQITNADGKPVALATGSSMYLPGRPASLTGVEQLASESNDPEDEPGA